MKKNQICPIFLERIFLIQEYYNKIIWILNTGCYLDDHVGGLLYGLAIVVPGDLGLGVAGEPGLEAGPHSVLHAHLLDLTDELGGLLSR